MSPDAPAPMTAEPQAADDLVVLNGIDPETGTYAVPPLPVDALAAQVRARPGAALTDFDGQARVLRRPFGVDMSAVAEVGWAVIYAEDTPPEVREALGALVAHRSSQAGDLVKTLDYRKGEQLRDWYRRHGIAVGSMNLGAVPYYLLLIGGPGAIPFEFQYLIALEYAVGRLAFDRAEDYARYAASVVAHETAASVGNGRDVVYWGTRHRGDRATDLSATRLIDPLANGLLQANGTRKTPLHAKLGYRGRLLAGGEAKRAALLDALHADKAPALLFTASHGMSVRPGRPNQTSDNGALLAQDWTGLGTIKREHYLAGADLDDDANVGGMIAFLFACFGCGTPDVDQFLLSDLAQARSAPLMAPQPFVAALPQRLLAHPRGSALAVLGHVDRAWNFSIQPLKSDGSQIGLFYDSLGFILDGTPVGRVMSENFGQRYSALSALLLNAVAPTAPAPLSDRELVDLWLERNDAQNYLVLGDPAVRIRKDALA
jgi:hypothetical protein